MDTHLHVSRTDNFVCPNQEGGIGIFSFAALDIFLIRFSVFESKDFGFLVLVFNAVCRFFVF